MSDSIKRYSMIANSNNYSVDEDETGAYVKFFDHLDILDEQKELYSGCCMAEDMMIHSYKIHVKEIEELKVAKLKLAKIIQSDTVKMGAAAKQVEELKACITLALRLDHAGVPGYISSALRGDNLEDTPFTKSYTVLDFLDAVEKEDLISEP